MTVRGLPFPEGEEVEVIVLPREPSRSAPSRVPLGGSVRRYERPFEPAADADD